jgi:CBS domain-containing protein
MSLAKRPVSEVMQREVVTLRAEDRLDLADDIMRLGRVRHMPVLDGERLVGVVSNRDLLAASLTKVLDFEPTHRRAFMRAVEVREVMSKEVVSVAPETPVGDAARIMIERQIGCLPVVKQEGMLLGLLTETDLLRAAYLGDEEEEISVGTNRTTREKAEDLKARVEGELDELRRVRDELRVRLHLAKAEAKDLWDHLERRFGELETHAKRVVARSEAPIHDMGDAARRLVDELRKGYRELRDQL